MKQYCNRDKIAGVGIQYNAVVTFIQYILPPRVKENIKLNAKKRHRYQYFINGITKCIYVISYLKIHNHLLAAAIVGKKTRINVKWIDW